MTSLPSTRTPSTRFRRGHPAPRRRGVFMRPGYLRALWCTALFFLIGMYIVVALARSPGDPFYDSEYIVLVGGMVTAPLGFLLGMGTFDYWLYWIPGAPRSSTTTRTTARTAGRTTSRSTPTTR